MSIFVYSDPLKKVVLSEVGAFSKITVRTVFLAWFFPFTNHATSLHARNAVRAAILATREEELALIVTLRKIL